MRSRMLGGLAAALMAVTVSLAVVHRARAAEAPKEVISVSAVSDSAMLAVLLPVVVSHVSHVVQVESLRTELARAPRAPVTRELTAADVILCLVAERAVDSLPMNDSLLSRLKIFVPPRYDRTVHPVPARIGARGSAVSRSRSS